MASVNKALNQLFTTDEFQKDIDYLYMLKYRWMDEREYEDFNDYIENAKKNIKSFKIKKMQKSFAIFFDLNGIDLKLKLNAKTYRFTRAQKQKY